VRLGSVAAGAGRECAPAALIGALLCGPSTSPLESTMAVLMVQVQPGRLPSFSEESVVQLRAAPTPPGLVSSVEVDEGTDDGRYVNISFISENLKALWPIVRAQLVRLGLQSACIVTCTGRNGWDDYLLLHHFDSAQPRDSSGAL
jgi:hypothetical protein